MTWDPCAGALPDVVPAALRALTDGAVSSALSTRAEPGTHRIILWLIDGLGYDQVERALDFGLMPHTASLLASGAGALRPIRTVFPSVTPVALASLLTGAWPGRHGLVGRYLYQSSESPWVDTLGRRSAPAGFQLLEPTLDQETQRWGVPYQVIMEEELQDGALTRILHPLTDRISTYVSPLALEPRLIEAANQAERGLVYAYWPHLDAINHMRGPFSRDWSDEITMLDRIIGSLAAQSTMGGEPVWLWIVADHGHQRVEKFLPYWQVRREMPELPVIPWGTDRMAGLALDDTAAQKLSRIADHLFGDQVVLRPAEQLFESGEMGPDVRREVRGRLGNWLLETVDGVVWSWDPDREPQRAGNHGGRSAEEMTIPFLEIRLR